MRRARIDPAAVADYDNLADAALKAARQGPTGHVAH